MEWTLFIIATEDSPGDGVLTPLWLGGSTVDIEPEDGARTHTVPVSAAEVYDASSGQRQLRTRLAGISGRLLITDSRVVVSCRRYQRKGGGWWGLGAGGATFALIANSVSKIRVAAAGAGKAAVGHVRYEWVNLVGWLPGKSVNGDQTLRVGYQSPASRKQSQMLLDITVPGDLDAALIAQEIVRRVARHRLVNHRPEAPDIAGKLIDLANAATLPPQINQFALYRLPTLENSIDGEPESAPVTPPNNAAGASA